MDDRCFRTMTRARCRIGSATDLCSIVVVITWYDGALPTVNPAIARLLASVAEAVALIERLGGRDYTRDKAREYRDKALAELDAASVVDAGALESLRGIIVGVIKA